MYRSIDHKKIGRKLKIAKKWISQATFAGIGALERCQNLIQSPDLGAFWLLVLVFEYAKVFLNVC